MKTVAAAIILRGDNVLICQRRPDQPLPLQWEFAGGKVEGCETPEICLQRELREELGIEAEIGPEVARFSHQYAGFDRVLLLFFRVTVFTGEPQNLVFQEIRWVTRADLPHYDFLAADKELVEEIARGGLV